MSLDSSKYDLEIVSLEPGHEGKTFKKYSINNQKTIGVFENEPFKICFRNKTSKKVQIRISIDGTDILTGEEASTAVEGKMWLVNPYADIELKAWPETNEGGSSFLFGKSKNSVAANTHGNMSATGIIAVAVFEETYTPPQYNINYSSFGKSHGPIGGTTPVAGSFSARRSRNISNYDYSPISESYDSDSLSLDESSMNTNYSATFDMNVSLGREIQTKAAVGAGHYVEQTIKQGVRLIKPELGPVIQLKYEWWTSLKSKIREHHKEKPAVFQGFPGDRQTFINLNNVPKIEKRKSKKKKFFQNRNEKYIEYQRFV